MKPIKLGTFGAIALSTSILWGSPSGLHPLPTGIVIPNYQGRALPVELLPDLHDNHQIWVKPNEGQFVSQGVVKSPIANCDLVKQELEIAAINTEARVNIAQLMRQAQLDYQKNAEKYKKIVQQYELSSAMVEPYRTKAEKAEEEKSSVFREIAELKREIAANNELITLETDDTKIQDLKKQNAAIEKEVESKKKEFLALSKEARTIRGQLSDLEIGMAEAKGKKSGMEKTLSVQFEELGRIQDQLDNLMAASEKVLNKYSVRTGGYTTFTSDFAPAEFIQELKKANPDYQFRYVTSVTATVDASIPGNIAPGSPLESRTGTLILSSKWSDPQAARAKHPLRKYLLEAAAKDPVMAAQSRIADFESSLSGTKFLSMELSVLGYCALKEPTSLADQFVGGAQDTFKLALYYTFPMNYAVRIKGRYNSYASLYDLHKTTKSSSWFGLSKSQKHEHIKRISNSSYFDVKVEPIGADLTFQESLLLTEKVKDQLFFFSAEPYLDKSTSSPAPPSMNLGELGATKVGMRLMLIPNPYTFWAGVVLTSLGEMFGSSSATQIEDISKNSWVNINYDAGFTFLVPGDITIGDLKRAPVVDRLEN